MSLDLQKVASCHFSLPTPRLLGAVGAILFVIIMSLAFPVIAYADLVPCSGVTVDGNSAVPTCQFCHVAQLIENINNWLVGILTTTIAIIYIVAGYRLVISAGDVGAKTSAKSWIINSSIGFAVVLGAWALMALLLRIMTSSDLSVWAKIECVTQPVARIETAADLIKVYGPSPAADLSAASTYDAGDCSPASLQSMGMNSTQAEVFSCISQYESNCNNNAAPKTSSARGVFQILRGYNDTCHNLNLSSCSAAASSAGWTGTGGLNCSQAFSGGKPKAGQEELANYCDVAASNQQCNVDAALCLYNDAGGYSPWLADPSSSKQRACVEKYAN